MNYSFHLGTKRLTETERLQLMRHIEETDDLDPYLSDLVQKANGALAQEAATEVVASPATEADSIHWRSTPICRPYSDDGEPAFA